MLWWRLWIVVYNYVLMHFGNTANKFALQQVKKGDLLCFRKRGHRKKKRGERWGGLVDCQSCNISFSKQIIFGQINKSEHRG